MNPLAMLLAGTQKFFFEVLYLKFLLIYFLKFLLFFSKMFHFVTFWKESRTIEVQNLRKSCFGVLARSIANECITICFLISFQIVNRFRVIAIWCRKIDLMLNKLTSNTHYKVEYRRHKRLKCALSFEKELEIVKREVLTRKFILWPMSHQEIWTG